MVDPVIQIHKIMTDSVAIVVDVDVDVDVDIVYACVYI